jgi:hypothetical protein
VDWDLFATIGNQKSLKDCKIPHQFPKFAKVFVSIPTNPNFAKILYFGTGKSTWPTMLDLSKICQVSRLS